MSAVLGGAPLGAPGLHGQDRLGAVERLNLRLLVHRQQDRIVRGAHVQPDHVPDLLHEERVNKLLLLLQ